MLLDTFWVPLEGLVHLVHCKDEFRGEDLLADQVAELDSHVHAVVVEEPNGVLLGEYFRDHLL